MTLLVLGLVVSVHAPTSPRWPLLLVPIGVVAICKLTGLYDRDALMLQRSALDDVPSLFCVATLVALVVWLTEPALVRGSMTRGQIAATWVLLATGLGPGRMLARKAVRSLHSSERCVLIGGRYLTEALRASMALRPGLELVTHFPLRTREGGRWEPLGQSLVESAERMHSMVEREQIHRAVVAVSGPGEVDGDLLEGITVLESLGLKVSVVPPMLEVIGSAAELEDLDGLPVLGIRPFGLSRSSLALKRGFDLVLGAAILLGTAPLMALIAAAVRMSSPGPILFRQTRVGQAGREFAILKFRTMHEGADLERAKLAALNESRGVFKMTADPRVTPVGRLLRRASLDELPQLFNVMRGEMSLVGPRPLIPEEDLLVEGWRRRRLELAPGMTGPWQVLGSTRVPLSEMAKIDYVYIANWSLWTDARALLQTLPHVVGRRGV